ncbi:MAG: hypothetical protein DYG89_43905 [Caldilinea sp. CFX5]|nr:hypothetical protein [Caldilinea sp. CFX5]
MRAYHQRVLVGTVGYHFLRDYSIGPKLLPQLKSMAWPPGVDVDELNWGPVAIVQHFETLAEPYDRVVILTATDWGKAPGTITLYRWRGGLPPVEEIQDRVAEAVTGTISVANLLVIGEHFGIWPAEVLLVDVQPGPEESGDDFTAAVAAQVPTVLQLVYAVATQAWAMLPLMTDLRGDAFLHDDRRLAAKVH